MNTLRRRKVEPLLAEITCRMPNLLEAINADIVGEDYISLINCVAKFVSTFCLDDKEMKNDNSLIEICRISSVLIDITWEKLNTGHWKDVDICWRYGYALTCLAKAILHLRNNNDAEAIEMCDKGILMGAPIIDNVLAHLGSIIHDHLISMDENGSFDLKYAKPLPSPHLQNPADRRYSLAIDMFLLNYYGSSKPVVLSDSANHFPAVQKWTTEYIWKIARYRTVPIEIGSSYADEEWSQSLMKIGDFIEKYFSESASSIGYLAQHHLFDQIIELKEDLLIPDYCMVDSLSEDEIEINAWFGPGGTVSPLHYDPRSNILLQTFGRKYVRLYSPEETRKLYPHDSLMLKNTSQVDIQKPDANQFPDFAQAEYVECLLEPGDMLYIPKKWWHFVKSLENSFSVNFWFGNKE